MTAIDVANRPYRLLIVVGVTVALLLAGVLAFVVITNDDTPYRSPQIRRVQQGCQQWVDSARGDGPSDQWCPAVARWMDARTGPNGQGQTWGSMMWRDSDSMYRTCQEWMTSTSKGNSQWCRQMVDWMNEHMGDWDNWMHGSMMGGP